MHTLYNISVTCWIAIENLKHFDVLTHFYCWAANDVNFPISQFHFEYMSNELTTFWSHRMVNYVLSLISTCTARMTFWCNEIDRTYALLSLSNSHILNKLLKLYILCHWKRNLEYALYTVHTIDNGQCCHRVWNANALSWFRKMLIVCDQNSRQVHDACCTEYLF